ncbi:uncharacterized protein LOC135953235 [Calliphora vicina]|uniref:uncharacterized protein LOC135953235 n=1 Tax=Calliphora vicina TaxID=7373 RepID=UPI00325C1B2B
MSIFLIFYSLLIVYVTFPSVTTKPTDSVSYIETLNFQHENDKWICGDVECPENTFGCKIRIKSDDDDKKVLHQSFTCFDDEKQNILDAETKIELPMRKQIDIDLETYVGAVSSFSTGYGMGGVENANGVVAENYLNGLKESARGNRRIFADIQDQLQL